MNYVSPEIDELSIDKRLENLQHSPVTVADILPSEIFHKMATNAHKNPLARERIIRHDKALTL